jgi:UDP-glucose 4-epimerase
MTILVTGGAGYIGSHMVYELLDHGEPVIILDNLSTGYQFLLPHEAQLVVGDVGDACLIAQVISQHQITEIIHFAASTSVPESLRDPLAYYLNNTANTRTLIEAAVRGGIKHFIFSSTAAVYGNPLQIPVSEQDAPAPLTPYGWSKLMAETMLRDAGAAHGLRHIILRYFNVAGADPSMRTGPSSREATHLIKVAVQAAVGLRKHLEVYGTDYPTADGTCVRDFIHVTDLVQAHSKAMQYLRAGGRSMTLNCGYGRGFSVLEVIAAVKEAADTDFPVTYGPRRAGDAPEVIAASGQARTVLGWIPLLDDLTTIVAHALAWERHLLKQPR